MEKIQRDLTISTAIFSNTALMPAAVVHLRTVLSRLTHLSTTDLVLIWHKGVAPKRWEGRRISNLPDYVKKVFNHLLHVLLPLYCIFYVLTVLSGNSLLLRGEHKTTTLTQQSAPIIRNTEGLRSMKEVF